ncbi:hypothetical protein [Phytoactinopolyspora limicola]|uniref:hypothetical protein n=1 Tax=Phytoactinopolyspora limicola TaxID=2715536 RepID=UPI001A9CAC03|nr:hypothetical protein [Phytoactinopolyspora limicola]
MTLPGPATGPTTGPTTGSAAGPTTGLMTGLVDDAGLFPPTALTMADAVQRHRQDLAQASPVLSHRFLCPVSRVAELRGVLRGGLRGGPRTEGRIRVGVIADAGAVGLGAAVAEIAADAGLELAGVEFPLARAGGEPVPAPVAALDAAVAAVDAAGVPPTVPLFVEPAVLADVDALAPAVAARSRRRFVGVKLRCGGVRAELFPSPDDLAAAVVAATRAGVAIKATAGLHHAVRYTDASTGFTHHGYLNLLVATAETVVSGAEANDVAATLRIEEAAELVQRAKVLDADAVRRTRHTFVSYGSCSTATPATEAHELGLAS